MALRINYNQASLSAQRSLGSTQGQFASAIERLSSGLRINRASDDSAGLAVSEKLKNQVRGLNQAQRNAQDAVSLLQTAEGALNETHSLLARMRELAVQSANDTLSNNDRAHLQNEVNQLVSEIDRIAASTQYNKIALLNKDSAVTLHNSGDALQFHIGANTNLVSGAPSTSSGDNALQFSIGAARSQDLGDVKLLSELGVTGSIEKTFTVGGSTIKYNPSVDTVFDVRDAINDASGTSGVTASVTGGKLVLASNAAFTITGDTGNLVSALGLPAAGATGSISGSSTVADVTGATGSFYIDDNIGTPATVNYSGTMTLDALASAMQTALRATSETTATVTVVGGAFQFQNVVSNNVILDPATPTEFGITSPLLVGTTTASTMVTIRNTASSSTLTGVTSISSSTDGTLDVASQTSANASISLLDAAIEDVSTSRGQIGSMQNRLESVINSLGVASENTAAANSRIRDADVAQAVSEMTRTQILQQATMAVLAQANQSPQSVLQLLK
jgi:flagellin